MPIIVTHNGNSLSATAVFLKSTPIDDNHATTKAYVDEQIAKGIQVTVAETPPTNPAIGTIWFDSANGNTSVYYDSTWVDVGGGVTLPQGITQADLDAAKSELNLAIDAVEVTVDAIDAKIDQKMPLYTNLPTNQIGDLSYLDLDIKGDYKGAQSTNYEKPYVLKERNGNFVGIRGGYNGKYRKQFYFTSPTDEFLASDVGLTDIEYRPKFLAATEYVSNLIDGNSDGFCVIIRNTVDTTKKFYWIRVNSTMDASKHTFIDITTLFTTSRGTGGSETFSNNFDAYVGPSASVVYCPEKQYWIATTRSSTEEIRFYIFNSSFVQLGTFLQVNLQDDVDYGTLTDGGTYTFMYTDHTNRNNIQYDYDAATNVLTITNLVTLVIYYTSNLAGGLYNSACTFNCGTNAFASVFTNKTNGKYTPNASTGFSNPQAYVAPFFSAVPSSYGTTPYYWADIKLRKFYNIGDGVVIETAKDHGWEPTHFNIIKHTLVSGKTWKDFILNPYAKGAAACSTYSTPGANVYGEQLQYVDDASLLGKDIRFASFISPNRILLKAQSKTAADGAPVRRRVIAKIDDITARQTIVTGSDGLASPSSVVKSTLPILDNRNDLHTVVDASGNMRVKILDGAVFKELNCDTGIGTDGSPSTASITNANVFTLPANYTTLISNIVKSDSLKIGNANIWRSGDQLNLCGVNWVEWNTNYDWHIYHLKNNSGGATFLLVYGYYSYDAATTTGTVRSCYKIISYSSAAAAFTYGATGTKIADWTSINGIPIRNLCGTDSAAVEAAGGYAYGGNTMTCGIYDDDTYISCIFKGIGCGGPGTNTLPTAVIKVQLSNGTIISENSYLTNMPTWHSESPCIHPTFGPCIIRAHEDEMTKVKFRFIDNISTTNLATRLNACFNTLFTTTARDGTYYNTEIVSVADASKAKDLHLLTLQAAQGFNVYTSEIPVFMNGSYYKMTPTAYNTASIVSTLGATVALPKSLYAYVELVNSAPVLIFNKTFIPNTATLTYVGEIQTDGVRIIYSKFAKSSDFTGANQDLQGTEGYQKLPGGLILQWGTYTSPAIKLTWGSPATITLPLAFPNRLLFATISDDGHAINGTELAQMDLTSGNTTLSQLSIYITYVGKAQWYAIGY
jgi:hypothetical protein